MVRKIDIPGESNLDLLAEELHVMLGDEVVVRGRVVIFDDAVLDVVRGVMERHNPRKKSDAQKRRDLIDRNIKAPERLLNGVVVELVTMEDFGKWTPEQKDALLYLMWQKSERGTK